MLRLLRFYLVLVFSLVQVLVLFFLFFLVSFLWFFVPVRVEF